MVDSASDPDLQGEWTMSVRASFAAKMSILGEIGKLSSYSVAFAEYSCNSTVILGYLNKTMLTG